MNINQKRNTVFKGVRAIGITGGKIKIEFKY